MVFSTVDDAKLALTKNRETMQQRYVEVFPATRAQMLNALAQQRPPNPFMMHPSMQHGAPLRVCFCRVVCMCVCVRMSAEWLSGCCCMAGFGGGNGRRRIFAFVRRKSRAAPVFATMSLTNCHKGMYGWCNTPHFLLTRTMVTDAKRGKNVERCNPPPLFHWSHTQAACTNPAGCTARPRLRRPCTGSLSSSRWPPVRTGTAAPPAPTTMASPAATALTWPALRTPPAWSPPTRSTSAQTSPRPRCVCV